MRIPEPADAQIDALRMEREIIFRGKLAGSGEWAYGNLTATPGCMAIAPQRDAAGAPSGHVASGTVGQHTGLRDRHGERIYEGDVLLTGAGRAVVRWDDGLAAFLCERLSTGKAWDYLHAVAAGPVEVIGNVHDLRFAQEQEQSKN